MGLVPNIGTKLGHGAVDTPNYGGVDDQTFLDLVDDQIQALLTGGAVKAWGEGDHKVEHMSITELYLLKQNLENRIAQGSGQMFVPVREIDQ